MTTLCSLPDELILHVMYFMDSSSVGQCRLVNKRLSRLAYDKVLVRKFPHYVLDGDVYFKEEAYLSNLGFLKLMKRDTNDLSWLVHRTTDIIKECHMDSISWCLLINSAMGAAGYAASLVAGYVAWTATRDAAWTAAQATLDASWAADWTAAQAALDASLNAARSAVKDTVENNIVRQIKALGITDVQCIGEKCYQIAECKFLLAIDKKLCLEIMAISDKHGLPTVQIPKLKLAELRGNPWIQQYVKLYGAHSL